ncbi:MAG TPA: hypothetical protein VFE15_16935 [Marmoricola sp.]|jgi:hypothetical protein|nr:hypothetical protein [Marmoricola sp.]
MDDATSAGRGSVPARPADPELLVAFWAAVASAHRLIESRHRYYTATALDTRLGEQLALLQELHQWTPVTEDEVRALVGLLASYGARGDSREADDEAHHAIEFTKQMIRTRGHGASVR